MLEVVGRFKSASAIVLVEAREKIEGTVGGKKRERRESVEERRKREWAEEVLFRKGDSSRSIEKVKG